MLKKHRIKITCSCCWIIVARFNWVLGVWMKWISTRHARSKRLSGEEQLFSFTITHIVCFTQYRTKKNQSFVLCFAQVDGSFKKWINQNVVTKANNLHSLITHFLGFVFFFLYSFQSVYDKRFSNTRRFSEFYRMLNIPN